MAQVSSTDLYRPGKPSPVADVRADEASPVADIRADEASPQADVLDTKPIDPVA